MVIFSKMVVHSRGLIVKGNNSCHESCHLRFWEELQFQLNAAVMEVLHILGRFSVWKQTGLGCNIRSIMFLGTWVRTVDLFGRRLA